MRRVGLIFVFAVWFPVVSVAQTKPKPRPIPAGVPVKATGVEAYGGSVEGRTYRNGKFFFEVSVPDDWYIAGPDFEKVVKENGFDLSLDMPAYTALKPATTAAKPIRKVDILMTAFRSDPESKGNAVLRVAVEDLKPNPQIKDAVDYFDAITAAYMSIKLPPDFKYSATKAEKLGPKQFAYLDTSSNAGKKRMYATVRNGFAIMFILSYTSDKDVETLRRILATGNFALK